jgi:signal transduction histidine kinase
VSVIVARPQVHERRSISLTSVVRPVGVVVYVAVVVAQLAAVRADPVVWSLFVGVALLALGSLLPLSSVPERPRFTGFVVWAVLAAVLFSENAGTVAGGFVFLAAAGAGQLLDQHWERAVVAVTASASTSLGIWALHGASHDGWPWWSGATAGIAVAVGLARRARTEHRADLVAIDRWQTVSVAADQRWSALLERTTTARRITDTVSESLSSVAIQLEVIDALLPAAPVDSRALVALRNARMMTRSGVAASRRVAEELDAVPSPDPFDAIDQP